MTVIYYFNKNAKPSVVDIKGTEETVQDSKKSKLYLNASIVNQISEYVRRVNLESDISVPMRISIKNGIVLFEACFPGKLDYKSCTIAQNKVNERLVCDVSMSYLSTLGGAFSSLGDDFLNCAVIAGDIAKEQFKIALRLKEGPMAARCCVFLALSFIQRGNFQDARKIILRQYETSKAINDQRLTKMCLGVWSKLQYTKKLQLVT